MGLLAVIRLAGPAEPPPVVIAVARGASLSRVEEARAAVPESAIPVTVASSRRAVLQDGLVLVTDRTFSDAPPANLIVVLPGLPDAALEEFLRSRRSSARAILFLADSPLAQRLRGESARGAVVLVGGPETIRTVVESGQTVAPTPTASPTSTAFPTVTTTPTPSATATPTVPGTATSTPPPRTATPSHPPSPTRVEPSMIFDRYFGAATRTPAPQ